MLLYWFSSHILKMYQIDDYSSRYLSVLHEMSMLILYILIFMSNLSAMRCLSFHWVKPSLKQWFLSAIDPFVSNHGLELQLVFCIFPFLFNISILYWLIRIFIDPYIQIWSPTRQLPLSKHIHRMNLHSVTKC